MTMTTPTLPEVPMTAHPATPDAVREALERVDFIASLGGNGAAATVDREQARAIRAAFDQQAAEIARLIEDVETYQRNLSAEATARLDAESRLAEADKLLTEVSRYLDPRQFAEIIARITTYLAAQQEKGP